MDASRSRLTLAKAAFSTAVLFTRPPATTLTHGPALAAPQTPIPPDHASLCRLLSRGP